MSEQKQHTKYLITIVGPTAIGKTAMAIRVAQHFNCEIISCDSRQFFREMNIGTAVPSAVELAAVPHHFIQHISIFDNYTVGDFERDALAQIATLHQKNDFVVMVGGSGLYVDGLLNGLDTFPEVAIEIREGIITNYNQHGIEYLQRQLQELDPVHYAVVAQENPQRLMRALEVSIASGQPYSSFLNREKEPRPFVPILIGLEGERSAIYDRINQRVDLMINAGLVEEARDLLPQQTLNALQTVGYRELFSYFSGDITLDFAIEEIKKNTRRFSKRQMTWFRKNPAIAWFDYKSDPKSVIAHIDSKTTS
ncbi:tRNA (adenosine(37)-N6)-dimethylallyltransferase MiaA [Flavobacterium kingsejongi]|uniref:tRNA dimethylallyltransferase n=1 Tax=Flavobacterium kingsejongi TaxID=1678728 RepID=A0A2S1LSG6_9FLAO|nr:tRNA (adenosine(37)-N6)-dimethylallyltransferase MiaA [Flavobacterium kingsejongi]AWG26664.1 tRNA (adenosine(37)-N6)-dimethylallyltransferase MiaA [Flavobacterium kingsejongi]